MKEYVVQTGPLRTFDALYDDKFGKLKHVADYHTIQITAKPTTQRRVMASLHRDSSQEVTFVAALFAPLAQGARAIFGIRDITGGRADGLARKLHSTAGLTWHRMNYGVTEDDLVLVELKDLAGGFDLLREFVPPTQGAMFFTLTAAAFDLHQIYWERAAQNSLKAKDDRFRRDILAHAHEARLTLAQEEDGSYCVLVHPKMPDTEAVEREIAAAGEKAGMSITFAPGLFS